MGYMSRLEEELFQGQAREGLKVSRDAENAAKVEVYRIMQDSRRVEQFYGLGGFSSDQKRKALEVIQDQLFESLLSCSPGYGVELRPDYTMKDVVSEGRSYDEIVGQVFRKKDKCFSADLVGGFRLDGCVFHRKETYKYEEMENRQAKVQVLICCDGATMLVPQEIEMWPPEILEKLSVTYRGQTAYYPDVFWRTIVQKLFNIDMVSPYADLVEIDSDSCYEELKRGMEDDYNNELSSAEVAENLIKRVNKAIGSFLETFFDGFDGRTCHLYPSGVMGVAVIPIVEHPPRHLYEDFQFRKNFLKQTKGGFASCGDVRVVADKNRVNDCQVVDRHDRLLDGLKGREIPEIVVPVANMRIRQVGNLQGVSVDIQKGSFDVSKTVVMYTDGGDINRELIPKGCFIDLVKKRTDFSAACFSKDPYLTLLLRRWQYRNGSKRPDDLGYILWRKHSSLVGRLVPKVQDGGNNGRRYDM